MPDLKGSLAYSFKKWGRLTFVEIFNNGKHDAKEENKNWQARLEKIYLLHEGVIHHRGHF